MAKISIAVLDEPEDCVPEEKLGRLSRCGESDFHSSLKVVDGSSARSSEQKIRRAREETFGRLTGCVAHDFKNLLMVIDGNVAHLRRKLKEPGAEPHLDAIHQAGAQATKLILQLLIFARGGDAPVSRLDLDDVVEKALPAVRELVGPGVAVRTRRSGRSALVEIDPVQLDAAILNLAANARDAMPSGGVLELAVLTGQDFVEFSVMDTGEGVPPDVLPHVFEPFFTTKAKGIGTGLGLVQVYGLARNAGGSTRIHSTAGQGTTVTLRLPLARGGAERLNVRLGPKVSEGEGPRVLVVDDDFAVRATIAAFLYSCSLNVREAGDAAEALALLEAEPFDALVTDICMPGELDGLGLAREARRRYPGVAILLASGHNPAHAEAKAEGFNVMTKPFDLSELERFLRA
jgi:DNA-binding response OmpR family regulator